MRAMEYLKIKNMLRLVSILGGILLGAPAQADMRYVSDVLVISVRDGQTNESNILGYLKSADAVEVLEEDGQYLKIQTPDGLEGWVQKKYVVTDLPKALIIEELKTDITALKSQIASNDNVQVPAEDTAKIELSSYEDKIAQLQQEAANSKQIALTAQSQLDELNQKYQLLAQGAEKASLLTEEIEKLRTLNRQLKSQLESRAPENQTSAIPENMKWFLLGCSVLLLGFVIGISMRRKKTYYY
jgi:SH3 domain protein